MGRIKAMTVLGSGIISFLLVLWGSGLAAEHQAGRGSEKRIQQKGARDRAAGRERHEMKGDRKEIRSDKQEIHQDRQKLKAAKKELIEDKKELRRDIKSGASAEEIARDKAEIQADREKLKALKAELGKDRQELRSDMGAAKRDGRDVASKRNPRTAR